MPRYAAPGVYVEEVPGTPPIAGVGTSTAGFVGVVDPEARNPDQSRFTMPLRPGSDDETYELAPAGRPQLLTSFEQFRTRFGDFQTGNHRLAHAIYGFFNNGGRRCWVVRVSDLGDESGAEAVAQALDAFEAIDEIAIIAVPGARQVPAQLAAVEHCERLQERVAIIDSQRTEDEDGNPIPLTADAIKGGLRNSPEGYAALYFPWLEVADPLSGGRIFVPPSGHMAGIYARVDGERGVHKAPANVVVRGALGLEHLTSRREQEGLNPDGINVIRGFSGDLRVWGARTLGGDQNGEFKYLNVRRLMNFLRESIEQGTRFAVFEPNSPALWQRIRRSVGAFLSVVWRDGALFGTTPEQAFYVRCDEETNPVEVRELGQVVTEIGVSIVRPAEFVIFKIAQQAEAPA